MRPEFLAPAQVFLTAWLALLALSDGSYGSYDADNRLSIFLDILSIGDVSVALRVGGMPQLIPNPMFVPIAGHVTLLHELLVDWSLGQHLLLLGEQGVGKNKLADKMLSLLRAERCSPPLALASSSPPRLSPLASLPLALRSPPPTREYVPLLASSSTP